LALWWLWLPKSQTPQHLCGIVAYYNMAMAGNSIAVGVPMFCRTEALANCLQSIPHYVDAVYVADNGENIDRDIYTTQFPFTLHVIDVAYDAGIGACRHALVEQSTEQYLWIGDNDMEFTDPNGLNKLASILHQNQTLGGVAGWLIEGNTVRAGARDLQIANGTAIKEAAKPPEMECNPYPFARFEFIPQAALFRRECFDTYNYDPDVEATEHLDFFLGHKQAGDWNFASTPTVMIQHNRTINMEYRESERGGNHADFKITAEKWGVEDTVPGARTDWGYVRSRSIKSQAFDIVKRVTPPQAWTRIRSGLKTVGIA